MIRQNQGIMRNAGDAPPAAAWLGAARGLVRLVGCVVGGSSMQRFLPSLPLSGFDLDIG